MEVIGGASDSNWFTSVIAILTVILSPPVSQAADYWGRKWFLVVLTICGVVGSIVVSRANSAGMAIAGFTITGLSYGAQPLLHAVVSEVLPRKYRPWAQATVNVSASLGAIFGLLVGGALTRNNHPAGFRTYWYITAAFYAVAAVLCAVLYNPPPRELQKTLTLKEKLHRLDWVAYFLLTSGLLLFCLGLSWSQNPYPWTNAHVLATFLVGSGLVIALIVYETRFKVDGMFHHALFRNRNFPIALTCVFVEGLVFFTANNYFAFEIGVLYTSDPVRVGLHYSIAFWLFGLSACVAAVYCSVKKVVRTPTIVAFVSFLLFNILLAVVKYTTPESNTWGYPVFLGIGLGICLTALITTAQFSTPPDLIAITSGLMISMRSLGGSVGLAIYTAIFTHSLGSNLAPKIAAAAVPLGLPASSLGGLIGALAANNNTAVALVPGISPAIIGASVNALKDAYAVSFRWVWVAAACFSAVAVLRKCIHFFSVL